MFDEKTLTESQEAETRWRGAFDQLQERMESDGRTPQTHSGLPIKNAYFPHDIRQGSTMFSWSVEASSRRVTSAS